MTDKDNPSTPSETEFLIAFSDLTLFAKFSRSQSDREVFEIMSMYFELVGKIVEDGGGKVVKFMGDAALMVFPAESVDSGVRALMRLKTEGDSWMFGRAIPCRHRIKAHFGKAVCGPIGTENDKRFDIYGQAVNTAATLESRGIAITPQAFRRLDDGTRKLFRKHTPPVIYVPSVQEDVE
ncbi:MAG: adenylate/guanylate cyclase domain-containing protein [Planctomycetota bacterium]|jgi:class 3 adenylate cyclase